MKTLVHVVIIEIQGWNVSWIIKDEKQAGCATLAMHPQARCCAGQSDHVNRGGDGGGHICDAGMGVMLDS